MLETPQRESELPVVIGQLGEQLEVAFVRADREQRLATTPLPEARRSRRRGFALALALAGVIVAILCLFGAAAINKNAGVSDALGDVAQRIEVAPQPKPSQFLYSRTSGTSINVFRHGLDAMGEPYGDFLYRSTHFESDWISVTHDGRATFRGSPISFPTARDAKDGEQYLAARKRSDEVRRTLAGRREMLPISKKLIRYARAHGNSTPGLESEETEPAIMLKNDKHTVGGELLTDAQLTAYPTDPKAIYARVRGHVKTQYEQEKKAMASLPAAIRNNQPPFKLPDVDASTWNALINGTGNQPGSAALRAQMIRALAYLPGVESKGRSTDPLGRPGDLFTWTKGGERSSAIFDLETANLLSSRVVLVDPAKETFAPFKRLKAGTVIADYRLLERKIVDRYPPIRR